MATVQMFRDESGLIQMQASRHPDWMAESLWVAVGAIRRGQAVIVMDYEAGAVADEVTRQEVEQETEQTEGSPERKPLTAAQVRMMFDALDRAAEMRRG